MRVIGTKDPGRFALGNIPGKPKYLLLRIFEHVTEIDGCYVYDEFSLALPDRPGIGEDIAGNISGYLAEAKAQERALLAETSPKGEAEAEAERIETEQALTDLYLDGIQAQQDITDLQIQLLED